MRLGRGNGGYDRWISAVRPINPSIQYIGVCFECQVVGDIAYEAHDEKVHRVVTSRGALS
jgi:5-formyltetrahydrofolate cyclo-ligase